MPAPPEAVTALEADDFEVVGASDCIMPSDNISEVFSKLEEDLKQQLKVFFAHSRCPFDTTVDAIQRFI